MALATSTIIALGALAASTAMQAASSIQQGKIAEAQGKAQQQAAEYQQKQANIAAGQERAAAQRRAIAQNRQTARVQSNLQARAAASGGGALDPSVIDITGDIAQEGSYRALSALYEGEERARGLETQGTLLGYQGRAARAAGSNARDMYNTKAIGSLVSGAASLYGKYAAGGPSTPDASVDLDGNNDISTKDSWG